MKPAWLLAVAAAVLLAASVAPSRAEIAATDPFVTVDGLKFKVRQRFNAFLDLHKVSRAPSTRACPRSSMQPRYPRASRAGRVEEPWAP